jgi:hypothetical protein
MLPTAMAKLRAWRADPVLFARECLGIEPWHIDGFPCATQRDVLRSCVACMRSATRSGHKTGKSCICAIIALQEFVCWPGSRTILTASVGRQVKHVLWRELSIRYRRARFPLGGELALDPITGLVERTYDTQVLGFTTDDPDKFSGISGKRVTYIVDEAAGVPPDIFKAIEGNRAGGARLILMGNPTQPVGEFFDAFHGKARLYAKHHISSRHVARAIADGRLPPTPGLAQQPWVDEMIDEWGEGSNEVAIRVDGDYPTAGATSIVRAADYDRAVSGVPIDLDAPAVDARLEMGLDVARFGDDPSVLYARRAFRVAPPIAWHGLDGPTLAAKVWGVVQRAKTPYDHRKKPRIRVEVTGVGASVFDQLRHKFSRWLEVVEYDPSAKSEEPEKFKNLRAEVWFNARDVLRYKPCVLPEHPLTRLEILSPTYFYDTGDRRQVEAKKDIKKRLGRSPDHGDALVICLWDPPAGQSRTVRMPQL